jgi:hypothetical protein
MATEIAKILLNQTIEACLLDRPVEQRLAEVNVCIRRLEEHRDEITEELAELKNITSILVCCQENLSPERELELTERLLTLYISVSDGALVF